MKLLLGKMEEKLKNIETNSVDSIVTDPPYHLTSIVKRFGPGQKPVKQKDGSAGAYSRSSKGFMGKEWDGGDIAFRPETWEECWRVLKPGGHLIAFSSARTYHRMAVAIEDGGFEIRDQIMWVYGSGFPKSHNLGKAYDKKRGIAAEKLIDPEFEMKHVVGNWYEHPDGRHFQLHPDISGEMSFGAQDGRYNRRKIYIEQFRKATGVNPNSRPNKGNIETNTHDYGFLGTTDILTVGDNPLEGWGTALKPSHEPMVLARKPISEKTVLDNAIKWGLGGINIDATRVPYSDDNPMPTMTGGITTMPMGWDRQDENDDSRKPGSPDGRWPANFIHDGSQQVLDLFPDSSGGHWPDSKTTGGGKSWGGKSEYKGTGPKDKGDGSAARFFYVPKVSKKDRNEGLDHLPDKEFVNTIAQPERAKRPFYPQKNTHPTVKPTDLMHYLIRMVTPCCGTVLDPFMGSGSTGKAAIRNGFNFIGIEMEEDSFEVAKARIEYERNNSPTESNRSP